VSVLAPPLEELLDGQVVGVMATESGDGRPRQSVVYYAREGDRLLVSSVAGRAKVRDVERNGWASLCVMSPRPPFPSATFSGAAGVLTEQIGPATAAVAQHVMGAAEPPEAQSEEALAAAGRVIVAISIERVSAATHLDQLRSG